MKRRLTATVLLPENIESTCSAVSLSLPRPPKSRWGAPLCHYHQGPMSESRSSSLRESARQEMPAPLRGEVRLLGELLGQVLTEFGGSELLQDVVQLRQTVIAAREDDDQEQAAEQLVASWPLERAEQVARAFACSFTLAT